MRNPYKYLKHVSADDFYNRDEVITQVLDSNNKENIAIIGIRRIGKSSVLRHIEHLTRNDPKYSGIYIPIYIDFETLSKSADDAIQRIKSIALREPLLNDRYGAKISLRETSLESFFFKISRIAQSENRDILFLCDEAQHIEEMDESAKSICDAMKVVSEAEPNFIVVVASSPLFHRIRLLIQLISSSEQIVSLGRFENGFPIELASLSKKGKPPPLSQRVINKIVKLSGGHPYFLQKLGSKCWPDFNLSQEFSETRLSKSEKSITKVIWNLLRIKKDSEMKESGRIIRLFRSIFLNLLRHKKITEAAKEISKGSIESDQFQDDIESLKDHEKEILRALAECRSKVTLRRLSTLTRIELNHAESCLSCLSDLGLVTKNGKRYEITNKFFQDWLYCRPSEDTVKRLRLNCFIAWFLFGILVPLLSGLFVSKIVPLATPIFAINLIATCLFLALAIVGFSYLNIVPQKRWKLAKDFSMGFFFAFLTTLLALLYQICGLFTSQ